MIRPKGSARNSGGKISPKAAAKAAPAIHDLSADAYLSEMLRRPRRNRRNAALRDLVRETDLNPGHLILPLFIQDARTSAPRYGPCPASTV